MPTGMPSVIPVFFASPSELRSWFQQHAGSTRELMVGFYKRDSKRPSISWPEAVDEALCVGWIDGVRKRIDEQSYQIRFTPRKPTSTWSTVNIARVSVLIEEGRMTQSGLAAFENRTEKKSRIYSYEQSTIAVLSTDEENAFQARPTAWAFFRAQPAGYRKLALWRVVSAKRAETREKRLLQLIEASSDKRRL